LVKAKVTEARASLRAASENLALSPEQREEYEKLMRALDELERQIQSLREV
jgi:pantothenate synthetase